LFLAQVTELAHEAAALKAKHPAQYARKTPPNDWEALLREAQPIALPAL